MATAAARMMTMMGMGMGVSGVAPHAAGLFRRQFTTSTISRLPAQPRPQSSVSCHPLLRTILQTSPYKRPAILHHPHPISPLRTPLTPHRTFNLPPPPPPRRPATVIYTRFPTSSRRNPPRIPLRHLWRSSPPFRYGTYAVLTLLLLTYLTNLERVPISNRLRFNLISAPMETLLSQQMYAEVLAQYRSSILPSSHAHSRTVKRILTRLLHSPVITGLGTSSDTLPPPEEWEVHIIHSPRTRNAFVLPGGKVFVFSGILPLAPSDSSLATILSHELAHVLAHHTGERVTQQAIVLAFLVLAEVGLAVVTGGGMPHSSLGRAILDLGFLRPASRRQEAEADYIGLMVMAEACFDPREAVGLWERMEAGEKAAVVSRRGSIFGGGGDEDEDEEAASVEIPQFLSTHPAHKTRISKLKEWMPEALERQARTDCTAIADYTQQFKKAFVFEDGFGGKAVWGWS